MSYAYRYIDLNSAPYCTIWNTVKTNITMWALLCFDAVLELSILYSTVVCTNHTYRNNLRSRDRFTSPQKNVQMRTQRAHSPRPLAQPWGAYEASLYASSSYTTKGSHAAPAASSMCARAGTPHRPRVSAPPARPYTKWTVMKYS